MAALPYSDAHYPDRLRHIPDPPLYLYSIGDTDLLRSPCIAVVGSRTCTSSGTGITENISRELASRGICIVSGFAWGIDRVAHSSAMAEIGGTAAVLGTGLDLIYPARNKDLWQGMRSKGLILTEFSPGTRPETHNFPRRNRIISGLCLGVLVTEAARNSGSLITAQYALEQNREVFAVPGSPRRRTYSGCNALIKRGAVLTRSAEDILQEIQPMLEEWAPASERRQPEANGGEGSVPDMVDLSDAEGELVRALDPQEPLHIDTLTRILNWNSSRTSQILLSLELKGVVSRQDGMHYTLLR
jgi:DNA processing protein